MSFPAWISALAPRGVMQTPYDAILNVGVRSWPTAAYREWQLSTHSEPSRLVNA